MSNEEIKILIEINRILIKKVEDQQKIIEKLVRRDEKDEREKKEKTFSKEEIKDYLQKNIKIFKGSDSFRYREKIDNRGFYCKMSYDMYLQMFDYLANLGIQPEIRGCSIGTNGIYYGNGLMFANLGNFKDTQEFMKKYFDV